MTRNWILRLTCSFCILAGLGHLEAGVSKEVETEYRLKYENKAMFLKQPIRGLRQLVYLRGDVIVPDQSNLGEPLTFKVGEQARITRMDFKDSAIEFEVAAVDLSRKARLIFEFGGSLTHSFHHRPVFDSALSESFTEGLTYQAIEAAKQRYVQDQFGRQVRQFVEITGLSDDAVTRAMLSQNALYNSTRKELDETKQQVDSLQKQLTEQQTAARNLNGEIGRIRRELEEANRSRGSLESERDGLLQKQAAQERELAQLRETNRRVEEQVKSIADKLKLESGSSQALGQQVGDLTGTIQALSQERDRLAVRTSELGQQLDKTKSEKDKLTVDLEAASRRINQLQSSLNALTTNRDGLEASFLRLKQEKESLEIAQDLERSLRVIPAADREGLEGGYLAEVFLLRQKIGLLTVRTPPEPEGTIEASFRLESPDTVQFTEEERRLYQGLGEKVNVQLTWDSWSGQFQIVPQDGVDVKAVGPREEASWTWGFQGTPSSKEGATLAVRLLTAEQREVYLTDRSFEFSQAGLVGKALERFSWTSMLVGLIVGILVLGSAVSFRKRAGAARKNDVRSRAYAPSKKF